MWTSKSYAAVGFPFGINLEITPSLHYLVFRFDKETSFGVTARREVAELRTS